MGALVVSVADKPAGMLFHEGIDPMRLRGWRPWAREKRKAARVAALSRLVVDLRREAEHGDPRLYERLRNIEVQLREETRRAA